MKILVLGGSGPIGSYLIKDLKTNGHSVYSTYLTNYMSEEIEYNLDVTNLEATKKLVAKINPDVVIDTIALSGVDLAENDNELADKVTVQGTQNVIESCKINKNKLIYISTTYVFGGREKVFSEDDIPCPVNYYGLTKYRAEQLLIQSGLKHLILRTDQPYGWVEKGQKLNSVVKTVNTLKAGTMLKEIVDWYSVPTYLPDFALATRKLLEFDESGIFHVTGPDYINRYDWSLKIAEIFGLKKNLIIPINSNELKLPAKRGNPNVSNEKLIQKTGTVMKGVTEGLLDMLKGYIQ